MLISILQAYTASVISDNRPSLIGAPLLPNNSVLVREVFLGERELYVVSQYVMPRILSPFYRGVLSRECPEKEQYIVMICIFFP